MGFISGTLVVPFMSLLFDIKSQEKISRTHGKDVLSGMRLVTKLRFAVTLFLGHL